MMTVTERRRVRAKGFSASGVHCASGRKKARMTLRDCQRHAGKRRGRLYAEPCQGAPILVTQENLKNGMARAIILQQRQREYVQRRRR
jgi:hypothetical protein